MLDEALSVKNFLELLLDVFVLIRVLEHELRETGKSRLEQMAQVPRLFLQDWSRRVEAAPERVKALAVGKCVIFSDRPLLIGLLDLLYVFFGRRVKHLDIRELILPLLHHEVHYHVVA